MILLNFFIYLVFTLSLQLTFLILPTFTKTLSLSWASFLLYNSWMVLFGWSLLSFSLFDSLLDTFSAVESTNPELINSMILEDEVFYEKVEKSKDSLVFSIIFVTIIIWIIQINGG